MTLKTSSTSIRCDQSTNVDKQEVTVSSKSSSGIHSFMSSISSRSFANVSTRTWKNLSLPARKPHHWTLLFFSYKDTYMNWTKIRCMCFYSCNCEPACIDVNPHPGYSPAVALCSDGSSAIFITVGTTA